LIEKKSTSGGKRKRKKASLPVYNLPCINKGLFPEEEMAIRRQESLFPHEEREHFVG